MMEESQQQGQADDHQAVVLVCFGGFSNTGYLTALGAMEAIRRVGLRSAGIACLAGIPAGSSSITERVRNAKRVITVDGCATGCARKIADAAGLAVTKSITLATDLNITKIPFRQHLDAKDPMDLIPAEQVTRVADAIVAAIKDADSTKCA